MEGMLKAWESDIHQGCDDFDTIESIGIGLAKGISSNFANIQSTSERFQTLEH